jgi:hypothetical protein
MVLDQFLKHRRKSLDCGKRAHADGSRLANV